MPESYFRAAQDRARVADAKRAQQHHGRPVGGEVAIVARGQVVGAEGGEQSVTVGQALGRPGRGDQGRSQHVEKALLGAGEGQSVAAFDDARRGEVNDPGRLACVSGQNR